MDFDLVISNVLKDFEKESIDYALIGGFALGLWGVNRATIDMDFLILSNDLGKVEKSLSPFAYQCVHKTENVVQYFSDLKPFGQIDVLLAFRSSTLAMLKRAVLKPYKDGVSIKVLIPEDIIGLKLQAMLNNPGRKSREIVDIESLLSVSRDRGSVIDWGLLEEYCKLFDFEEELNDYKVRYG